MCEYPFPSKSKNSLSICTRAEFGGPVLLNRHWAYSLLRRMKFVKRKFTISNFEELKESFLNEVVTTVFMEEIPPDLILNWDQTGIKIVDDG